MNTIKTVFLAALLSAAAYGVYVGVTGTAPNFGPRRTTKDWDDTAATDDAPLVSIDDASTTPVASSAPQAVGAPLDGLGPQPAAPQASLPSTPAAPAPPAGDTVLDRFSSTQPYPSTRPDAGPPPPSASSASDLAPQDDRYAAGHDASNESGMQPQGGPASTHEETHADFAALMQSVQGLLDHNRLADAHLELSEWFGEPHLSAAEDAQLTDLLDRLAGTVVYSRQHLLERPYDVQPGDTLDKIADTYEVPWELLANINGIRDPRAVRPGDQIKVVRGPFNAHVSLSRLELVLYLGNRYAGRFRLGVGQDREMPEGKYVVLRKLTNPIYYGQQVVDKDDPNNPLGEFAIDLGNGISIHGTNDPGSIGRTDSRGCICLADRDIRDVFEILTAKSERSAGSQIVIRR